MNKIVSITVEEITTDDHQPYVVADVITEDGKVHRIEIWTSFKCAGMFESIQEGDLTAETLRPFEVDMVNELIEISAEMND